MEIKVFAIGGNWKFRNLTCTGECFIGTAHDAITAMSLLDLVEKNGGYAVSLHGKCNENTLSGEFTLPEARNHFNKIIKEVDQMILDDLGLERI